MSRDIYVHIDQFDGPLALLLYLVQKDEMDIQNLNLTQITGQYLSYINKMNELNFDVAGEYLYLASILIFLKSEKSVDSDEKQRLLDAENELHIETREQLIAKLLELEKYQRISQGLWSLPKQGYEIYSRPKLDKKQHFEVLFKEMDMSQLTNLMIDMMKRQKRKVQVISKERLSIKKKLVSLKELLFKGKKYIFKDLIPETDNKLQEVVMTFISLLELARLRKIEVFQAEDSKEIYVDVVKSMEDFDVNQADGFDAEDAQYKPDASGADSTDMAESEQTPAPETLAETEVTAPVQ